MLIDSKIEARFWDKVLVGSPEKCWLWLGATNNSCSYRRTGGRNIATLFN
ncbi:hypothetical protein LCGC14_0963810 [marine sediment metagenome]|uniref:Uncharacterized protein n=1 Tax=marine sediment metagenome TaxID=412755 RepID=A0A0F9NI56_9ZZZZ